MPVTQHLADRDQRRTRPQQIAGQRVTQLVSADRLKPGTLIGVANERPDAGRLKRTDRRLGIEEQPLMSPVTDPQIGHERLADINRQRQPPALMGLAVELDLTRPPVEIGQLESRDLDRAQPQP